MPEIPKDDSSWNRVPDTVKGFAEVVEAANGYLVATICLQS